jgi:puromycin-sensitive aminopeptidase
MLHSKGLSVSKQKEFRLPKHVIPINYKITLTPGIKVTTKTGDAEEVVYKFTGVEEVLVKVLHSTDRIVLHSANLDIHSASFVTKKGKRIEGIVTLDPKNEFAIITFNGIVPKGKGSLHMSFTGIHNTKLKGFYLSQWQDADKNDHQIFTTQFESTDARQAFPCFDEPAMKATFDVRLIVDSTLTALSNGRDIKTESIGNGKKMVTYERTPHMSTYLVAFCVGEFESSRPVFANGKEIRIWSIPGKNDLKEFALECGAFGVKWYEDFFDRPYFGGDKIDMIAIPDFASGAMENTGLITYRDTALLVNKKTASYAELARVCEVILHELAHQWNGNEVTMDDWDGLGLNESFATIMAYLSMNDMFPEWHVYNEFGIDRAGAFALDSLRSTHAVEIPVSHPDDIQQFFDTITYEKGGSLLFQYIQYAGFNTFRTGMRIYFQRHALGNATVSQLWDALEEGAKVDGKDIPVRRLMDFWWKTAGHPVVSVAEGDKPGTIKVTQKKFQFLPAGDQDVWPVPLHIRYKLAGGEVVEQKHLFDAAEETITLGDKEIEYVVLNAGGSGFYRVDYSDGLREKALADVQNTLQIIERFNLVNDSWASVRARAENSMTTTEYLDLVKSFSTEADANVWAVISGALKTVYGLTEGDHRQAFKAAIRATVRPVFDQLGWTPKEGESVHTLQLRGQLIGLLGTVGSDKEIRKEAAVQFDKWKADRSSVDPNVVPALISTLSYTGDRARFDEFLALSESAPTTQEKLRFLGALGNFREEGLYKEAIELTLSGKIRTQDAPFILAGIIGTEHAGETAWDFMRDNWAKIVATYPDNAVPRMVSACSALDTPELQAEVVDFFAKNKVKEGDMAVAQMIERLSVNVGLREAETAKLTSYLEASAKALTSTKA